MRLFYFRLDRFILKKLSQNKSSSLLCFYLSVLLESCDGNQGVENWGFLTLSILVLPWWQQFPFPWVISHIFNVTLKILKTEENTDYLSWNGMVALGDHWSMCVIFLYQWPVHPLLPIGDKLLDFSVAQCNCVNAVYFWGYSLFQNNKRSYEDYLE